MNRASADRMTQAETVWALRAPEAWPAAAADAAWKKVLLYTEHTWGAWNSISQPEERFVKDQWDIKRGYAEEADWLSRKLLARREPGNGVRLDVRRRQHAVVAAHRRRPCPGDRYRLAATAFSTPPARRSRRSD